MINIFQRLVPMTLDWRDDDDDDDDVIQRYVHSTDPSRLYGFRLSRKKKISFMSSAEK